MSSQKFLEVTREPAEASRACQAAGMDTRSGDDSGTGPSALPIQEDGAKHLTLAGKLFFAELCIATHSQFPHPKGAASVLQGSLPKKYISAWEIPLREV